MSSRVELQEAGGKFFEENIKSHKLQLRAICVGGVCLMLSSFLVKLTQCRKEYPVAIYVCLLRVAFAVVE